VQVDAGLEALAGADLVIVGGAGVLYVDGGDVLTSAGLAAGMDLCLHVVRADAGADAAAAIARWNVVAPHRDGGQAQYIDAPPPDGAGGSLGAVAPARAARRRGSRAPRPPLDAHLRAPVRGRDRPSPPRS
jgi:hypothetical protein